uniref:Docking protein 3-like n=1 Tax=Sparus aurata TaxID=8175 RepID=A0A671VFU0_SPAAU
MWAVLFKPSSTGVGRLELCTKTPERKVVRLRDCLSADPAPKESCPPGCTAFYLNTIQCNYTLASTASQDWLKALCVLAFQDPGESDKGGFEGGNGLTMEDNELYSSWKTGNPPPNQYQVTIQSTEASRRCQLSGQYLVWPEKQALTLLAINTGHTIYRWPYILLRKFGQVEGGFSIEAGRRCDSGEGVFIFLSRHGQQIFQTILNECSVKKSASIQPAGVQRSAIALPPIIFPTTSNQPTVPPVSNPAYVSVKTDHESACHYSTIEDISRLNLKQPSLGKSYLSNSKEAVGEEDEDERYHSLDDRLYSNVKRATPPITRKDQSKPSTDTECIYADVKIHNSTLNPQLQHSSSSPILYGSVVSQPPPCPLPQAAPLTPPRARYQRQPPANNYIQPGYNAQAQAVDDMKEMEEAISSSCNTPPSEAPGSFKHRLAEIISKDLAKFQPLPPSGAGSPTFSQ